MSARMVSRRALWLLLAAVLLNGCDKGPAGPPVIPGSQLPDLSAHPDGGVLMSWVEPAGDGHRLRVARYHAGRWDTPATIASGAGWFVNWADVPSVRVIDDGWWAAHWLVKHRWQANAYDVVVSMSEDAGRSWSQPIVPHGDGTATEHGFVSLYPLPDSVGLVWLDGRNTLANTSGDQIVGTILQSAVITRDGGRIERTVDELVCDCCQTSVAVGADGPLLVYRDRDHDEIRDIRLARHDGQRWVVGGRVAEDNWQVFGCPVNGPAIAASGRFVAIAWFTRAGGGSRVQLAVSADAGRTFAAPVVLDDAGPLGRVDVAVNEAGSALVSWLGAVGEHGTELKTRLRQPDGRLEAARTIAFVSFVRPGGFPRMAPTSDGVLLAWTDLADDATVIRTREILDPWNPAAAAEPGKLSRN